MKTSIRMLALIFSLGACSLSVSADVIGIDLGTADPPSTLGGYSMYNLDLLSLGDTSLQVVGPQWFFPWGHGFTGAVFAETLGNPIVFQFSPGTKAFYFYAQPGFITAADASGVSVAAYASDSLSSNGFGFYVDNPGESLSQITVTSRGEFAVGQFHLNGGTLVGTAEPISGQHIPGVPETGSTAILLFLGLGLLAGGRRMSERHRLKPV